MASQQMAIANIERIDIITEEPSPRVFSFDTAKEASAEAQISAGAENELRIKNQILAQNITEDIVKGFNISFTDTTFSPDVFALSPGIPRRLPVRSSTASDVPLPSIPPKRITTAIRSPSPPSSSRTHSVPPLP